MRHCRQVLYGLLQVLRGRPQLSLRLRVGQKVGCHATRYAPEKRGDNTPQSETLLHRWPPGHRPLGLDITPNASLDWKRTQGEGDLSVYGRGILAWGDRE